MAKQAAKLTPNINTLEVFKAQQGVGLHDHEGYAKSYYNASVAKPKDMSVLKQTSAGIHKDSAFSVKQLKEELLAHSFKVGHRQEPDAFDAVNAKFLKKHGVSSKKLQDAEAASNHAKDWTTNWGLRQSS